jgi:hypothetical protein
MGDSVPNHKLPGRVVGSPRCRFLSPDSEPMLETAEESATLRWRGAAQPVPHVARMEVPPRPALTLPWGVPPPPASIEIGVPMPSDRNAVVDSARGAWLQYCAFVAFGGRKSRRWLAGAAPRVLPIARNVAFFNRDPLAPPGCGVVFDLVARPCKTRRRRIISG